MEKIQGLTVELFGNLRDQNETLSKHEGPKYDFGLIFNNSRFLTELIYMYLSSGEKIYRKVKRNDLSCNIILHIWSVILFIMQYDYVVYECL